MEEVTADLHDRARGEAVARGVAWSRFWEQNPLAETFTEHSFEASRAEKIIREEMAEANRRVRARLAEEDAQADTPETGDSPTG